jgi:serine/threonine protein phosphatase 1
VDRGPRSDLAKRWLDQPFFYAIRGNHEDLYLEWRSLREQRSLQAKFEQEVYFKPVNGGAWVKNMTEAEHVELEEALSALPYFLAVPHVDGTTIGVVHAELPDGSTWPGLINTALDKEMKKAMTWGRLRWQARRGRVDPAQDRNRIAGLDALVCGHVRIREATGLGNIVYLDTGGWSDRGEFSILAFEDILDIVAENSEISG